MSLLRQHVAGVQAGGGVVDAEPEALAGKSKPGLSGSMSRNAIISPHFGQRGLLITFANTAYPQ
jgi:hypothetical protein